MRKIEHRGVGNGKMTHAQYAARLASYPNGWIIEQVREYGEYMARRRVALCLIELRRRGAVTRECAMQALDLYAPARRVQV